MNYIPILKEKGLLKEEDAVAVESEARTQGLTVESILLKKGFKIEDILKAASEVYNIPSRALPATTPADKTALEYIPEESARHYRFAPLKLVDGALEVGVLDPDNLEALDALQFISTRVGVPYKLFLISQSDFERVLDEYGSLTGEVGEALNELNEPTLD
ncbi:hypothetical protein KKH15_02955, partial [Patescibacteria group bacterium]|nr:hypothetical protein [Patescibacteria group bacterium]MBU1755056.1 hypothetical protein [Patescibacteria group bacterium]